MNFKGHRSVSEIACEYTLAFERSRISINEIFVKSQVACKTYEIDNLTNVFKPRDLRKLKSHSLKLSK